MTSLNHIRNDGLAHNHRSVKIDIDNLTELSRTHLTHRDTFDDTGIINKDINISHFFLNLGNEFIDHVLVCYVTNIPVSIDTTLFVSSKTFINKFLFKIVEHDGSTCLC